MCRFADGRGIDCLNTEMVGGDDAIVEYEFDVRLRGETAECGCVVLLGSRLDGCDPEVFVAVDEACAGGGDSGCSVSWDGGVAIEDKVVIGRDAGGVDRRYLTSC